MMYGYLSSQCIDLIRFSEEGKKEKKVFIIHLDPDVGLFVGRFKLDVLLLFVFSRRDGTLTAAALVSLLLSVLIPLAFAS